MVVDVQHGFVTDENRHVVAPLERLQGRFRHVVVTKFHNPPSSPFRELMQYERFGPGSADTELAFVPRADAFLIDRPLYTCVTQALLHQLEAWHLNEVYVAGIATEACILKTVIDLFEHRITPWVIADLCDSDKGAEFHEPAMKVIGKLIDPRHLIGVADIP
jgi:nicotinamidase-related amidase